MKNMIFTYLISILKQNKEEIVLFILEQGYDIFNKDRNDSNKLDAAIILIQNEIQSLDIKVDMIGKNVEDDVFNLNTDYKKMKENVESLLSRVSSLEGEINTIKKTYTKKRVTKKASK